MANGLHAIALLATGATLVASSRHAGPFRRCRICAVGRRRGASAAFGGPRLRWVMAIVLHRLRPAVNHVAEGCLSWPGRWSNLMPVARVEEYGVPATNPCRLDGDCARRSSRPPRPVSSSTRPGRMHGRRHHDPTLRCTFTEEFLAIGLLHRRTRALATIAAYINSNRQLRRESTPRSPCHTPLIGCAG